ncbi:MAG: serine hydrolase [Saprospiraceae bacterium]
MSKTFIILFFFIISISALNAQKKKIPVQLPVDKTVMFDNYITASMPLWHTTGLSVGIVKDGKVIFKKGYGVTNINTKQPFETNTIAYCASTTKAMTAVCMAILIDEGKVKWDDKLKDVLPEFRMLDPNMENEITVRDLFRHNAGFGNADNLWLYGYSSKEIVKRMRFLKPAYSMRSSFIYQNLMYVVAGEVIEKISGIPWHQFIQTRLFTPLGMQHTYTIDKEIKNESSVMTPHFFYGDTSVQAIQALDFGGYDPAGSVVSCADDITKWMQFLQDSSMINGKRLLKAGTFAELFKPQSFVTPEEFYPTKDLTKPHWMTYGLGWFQQDYRGRMFQFHTGSLDGAVAIHGFMPEEKFSIYIFGNLDHTEIRHALMWKATDLWCFDDTQGRDWSTDLFYHYKKIHEAARKKTADQKSKRILNTEPSFDLQQYTGKYANEIYGDAEVILDQGNLKLVLPNHISLKLTHWHYDVFLGQFNYLWSGESFVSFNMSNEGKINKLTFDGFEYDKK